MSIKPGDLKGVKGLDSKVKRLHSTFHSFGLILSSNFQSAHALNGFGNQVPLIHAFADQRFKTHACICLADKLFSESLHFLSDKGFEHGLRVQSLGGN